MIELDKIYDDIKKLQDNIASVFIGKDETIQTTIVAFIAEGHLLLEDVPGVGKTLLGQALAKSLDASFARVQFTSDLLPSDVVGSDVYLQKTQEFQFVQGPIFSNVVLADEVNRTPPRTQSAMLEAMSERQVSVGGQTYPLPRPFFVVATQNPIESEGVYPLPESQLDRFLMRISVGYPDRDAELKILDAHGKGSALESLKPVLTLQDALALQDAAKNVRLDPDVANYLIAVVDATRQSNETAVGASPRATLALARAVRARALAQRRDYVVPDDVKALAARTLAHRLVPKNYRREESRRAAESLVERVLASVETPR